MVTKKRLRPLALALLLVLLLSMAAQPIAIAESDLSYLNETGAPICNEPITITVKGKENNGRDWNNQFLIQYIEKNLGIKMDITTYTNEQWSTQFSLMLATNDLPDLFIGANTAKDIINNAGTDGFLLDLSQYADWMPNYQALCEEYPLWANYQKADDGAVYGLSRLFPSRIGLSTAMNTFVKKSWLEQVGMEMPTTLDEFYEVLVAFKEQDANGNGDPNDEIPLVYGGTRGTRLSWILYCALGFCTQIGIDAKDGEVYSTFVTEEYKAYLSFMHKLYAEGLLDPAAFIQTDDERVNKAATDVAGFFVDYGGLLTAIGGGDGSKFAEYDYLVGLTSEYNDSIDHPMGNSGYADGARTFVSASTKYPEAIARLVDFFLAPDADILCDYGVEGETFSYVADAFGNQVPSFTGFWEDKYATESEYKSWITLDETFKLIRKSSLDTLVEESADDVLEQMIYEDPQYTYTSAASLEKAMRQADRLVIPFPQLLYSADEAKERSMLKTDIDTYVNMMTASFIMGEADIESTWDSYVAEIERMGLDKLVAIEQAAYDRFMK